MSSRKSGPFAFLAAVIIGCLAVGVGLAVFAKDAPALVVSVVLSCGVASLLYGILGVARPEQIRHRASDTST